MSLHSICGDYLHPHHPHHVLYWGGKSCVTAGDPQLQSVPSSDGNSLLPARMRNRTCHCCRWSPPPLHDPQWDFHNCWRSSFSRLWKHALCWSCPARAETPLEPGQLSTRVRAFWLSCVQLGWEAAKGEAAPQESGTLSLCSPGDWMLQSCCWMRLDHGGCPHTVPTTGENTND